MLIRRIEADVLPVCERYGMGVIPWSPLAGGWLSGRYGAAAIRRGLRRAQMLPARYDMSIPANRPSSRPPRRSASWPSEAACR